MGEELGIIGIKGNWHNWKAEAEKALKGKGFDSLLSSSYEGITIKPLYTKEDTDALSFSRSLSNQHTNDWKINQVISAKDCHDISQKIKQAKLRGQDSFYIENFSFLKTKKDLTQAFRHIDWNNDSFLFDIGNEFGVLPLFLHERKANNELKYAKGTIGFDPFTDLLLNGKSRVPLSDQYDFLADTMKWCKENDCNVRCLLIKGSLYHEAGANALQELTYTFSQALDIINELLDRGVSLDVIAKNTTVSFSLGSNFFMEIAKIRASKRIWASLIHALGGNKEAQKLYIHTMTSTFNKTVYDVQVNLLRTTTEGFSAAVAGVDELTILPFDSVLSSKNDLGERIARNTQFIFKEESLFASIVDPSGGSYYVESLTNELAEKAWKEIQVIDENNGFLTQLVGGKPQSELNDMLEKRVNDVNNRKTSIIGTNIYADLSDEIYSSLQLDKEKSVCKSVRKQVGSFNEALVFIKSHKEIPLLEAQNQEKKYIIEPIKQRRLVEHFEKLRINAEKFFHRTGQHLQVAVIVFGKLKDYKSRLDFITGLFASGGIKVDVFPYDRVYSLSNVNTVIFCGKDKDYDLIDDTFISNIKKVIKPVHLFIVGSGHKKILDEFGFDGFVSPNMNIYEFLVNMHQLLGARI